MVKKIGKYVGEVRGIVKKRRGRFMEDRAGSVRTTCSIDSYTHLIPKVIQTEATKNLGHSTPEFV